MRIFLTAAAGALALSALAASAQDLTTGHLGVIDQDDDGAVSAEELNAVMAAAFTQMDANGDGSISAEEGGAIFPAEIFAGADADTNGALSRAEFDAQVERDFAGADRDASGALN